MRCWQVILVMVAVGGWTLSAGAGPAGSYFVAGTGPDGGDLLAGSEDGTLVGLSERFVAAEGYRPQSVEALNEAIGQRLVPADSSSVFLPSGTLSPFVKAVLALEAVDGVQERVRYRLSYGQAMVAAPPAASPLPVSLVQIDRFNLGPVIRKELVEVYGAENVAPPAVFGVGPHVSWRLGMRPLMGHQADIVAASRMEIAAADAGAETCFGRSCLSTAMVIEDAAPWSEVQASGHDPSVVYPAERDGLPTPAAVVDMLTNEFGFEAREGVGASEPFAVVIMELNLGQDATLDAALREGALMDDSVSAVWRRISATPSISGATPHLHAARAFECQRGPKFAEPGKHCP